MGGGGFCSMGGGGEGLYPLPAPIPSTMADFSRDISENIHDVRFALLPIQLKLQSTWRDATLHW